MIRVEGRAFLGCDTGTVDYNNRNYPRGALAGCGQPATILILADEEVWHAGDVQETFTVATAACAEHAPDETREAAASRSADEYVIAPLTVIGPP